MNDLYIGIYDLVFMVCLQGSIIWEYLFYLESFNIGQEEELFLYCMVFDEVGVLWVGIDIGLLSYNNGIWLCWENMDSLFYGVVWGLDFFQDGYLLIVSYGVFCKEGEELVFLSFDEDEMEEFFFVYGGSVIYEVQDGQFWFFIDLGMVGVFDGENWNYIIYVFQFNIFGVFIFIMEFELGVLWILIFIWLQFIWNGEVWFQEGMYQDWEKMFFQYEMLDGELFMVIMEELQVEGGIVVIYGDYFFVGLFFQFKNDFDGGFWGKDWSSLVLNMEVGVELIFEGEEGGLLFFSWYIFVVDGLFWCVVGFLVVYQFGVEVMVYDLVDSFFFEVYGWELYFGLFGLEVWIIIYEDGLY